jgi:hypothetical protein
MGSHIAPDNQPFLHTRIARAHLGAGRIADALPAARPGPGVRPRLPPVRGDQRRRLAEEHDGGDVTDQTPVLVAIQERMLGLLTSEYTPGNFRLAQPLPQLTIPTWTSAFGSVLSNSGPPLSP